ncbi:MAG: small subunit ribosomal protein S5 [Candidatus Paceibacteria bacterium]|jgi:small subunit ribosomal protein S5
MSEEQKTEQAVVETTDTPKTDAPAQAAETKVEEKAAPAAEGESKEVSTPTGADTKPAATSSRPVGRGGYKGAGGARRSFGGKKPGFRKGSRFRSERPKPEFEQKIINISRVTRVVKGGRRLSFRVDMVIGDKKGRVGLGSGKATDTSLAIQKAFTQAKKNLIKVKTTKNHSIPYVVDAKVTSSRVEMMPNKERGLVAGSTMRTVLELVGVTDVTAKIHSRSKNKLNNAKAAIKALAIFSVPMDPIKDAPKPEAPKGRFNGRGRQGGGQRRPFNANR